MHFFRFQLYARAYVRYSLMPGTNYYKYSYCYRMAVL